MPCFRRAAVICVLLAMPACAGFRPYADPIPDAGEDALVTAPSDAGEPDRPALDVPVGPDIPAPPDAAPDVTTDLPPPLADAAPPDAPSDLPLVCVPACTLSSRRCGHQGGLQTCETVNGCASWSPEKACPIPTHGIAACTASACTHGCEMGYLSCSGGTCESPAHTFDTGLEGAHVDSSVTANYSRALRRPIEVRPFMGGRWLAADVRFSDQIQAIAIVVPFCPGTGTTNLRGRVFSATLYVDGPATSDGMPFRASASLPAGVLVGSRPFAGLGATVPLEGTFPDDTDSDQVRDVVISVGMRGAAGSGWEGTIYLDDLQVR